MSSAPESSPAAAAETSHSRNDDSGVDASPSQYLLSLRGISKSFGPVQALQNVDLDVPAGQVTAIIGDNGAGKSTLIKLISGIWSPSSGQMFWNGKEVQIHTPHDATVLGIATVKQIR
jgi:D-xylose transport system ATP-binding protein